VEKPMTELRVTLEFVCCGCDHWMNVTLHCTGKDLDGRAAHDVAAVNVPCPTCGRVNRLYFEPCGTVRAVRPYPAYRRMEPSFN
jgi:sarcosine oxidase delta subunit